MIENVRVRFAPSPTGYVHIGSLRTALYNYLFARKFKGCLILRIEDTDRSRFVDGAVANLFATMDWAGIHFDENIRDGGQYGPYQQSQRLDIYLEHINLLLEKGYAYPCFCTQEELETIRNEQTAKGLAPRYDGRCRHITAGEARKRMQNESHVIRMRVPDDGETMVKDIIRGDVTFQNNTLDDQIILKGDGYPTYHLANVVDDHLMQISHVIRGEEWLPSTPKHVLLYNFFGWELPQFAHLPLLLNPDRSKLSKRQGDVTVEDYRTKGYLPDALVNFVALLGWSKGDGSDQEIFSIDELISNFSLEKVNKAGAVFDQEKLEWMNGQYIRAMDEAQRVDFLTPFLAENGLDIGDKPKVERVVQAIYQRINKGQDVAEFTSIFTSQTLSITENDALDVLKNESAERVIKTFLKKVDATETLDAETFIVIMKAIQKEEAVKGPALWMPVRVALTGQTHGPELPQVIEIFGKEKVIGLVEQAINYTE